VGFIVTEPTIAPDPVLNAFIEACKQPHPAEDGAFVPARA
jgi:hypothetical protein